MSQGRGRGRTMYCCARNASCLVRWMRSCCCCMARRCFCTYCLTGVQTGQAGLTHFWWCFSSSRLVTHLCARAGFVPTHIDRTFHALGQGTAAACILFTLSACHADPRGARP
jgi:hypothetical protein